MFRGGHERWDGVIEELHTPEVVGTGYAERWVREEDLVLGYTETDEIIEVPITEGAKGRERTKNRKVVVYQYITAREVKDVPRPTAAQLQLVPSAI